jgi:hypothetical protein
MNKIPNAEGGLTFFLSIIEVFRRVIITLLTGQSGFIVIDDHAPLNMFMQHWSEVLLEFFRQ